MLKVNDFVFALLTLIFISSVAGEEQIFPEAKEWPKYSGFEWGMSKEEFYEACTAKNLKRYKRLNSETGTYYLSSTVKGKILGKDVEVRPFFESGQSNRLLNYRLVFTVSLENREEFFNHLFKILREKYGPAAQSENHPKDNSKEYRWGAPDMPDRLCLKLSWGYDLKYYTENLKTPNHAFVFLTYNSKAFLTMVDESRKKRAAEQRELEKKAKEDEKDF